MVRKHKAKKEISNRLLYTLITIGILAILGVGVYAVAGSVPNPGHSLLQLQPCSDGETLKMVGTSWTCAPAGSAGGGNWTVSGSNIYYNLGNVGIGTTNPIYQLSVVENNAKTDTTDRATLWQSSNEPAASYPFGMYTVIKGAAALADRSVRMQTMDYGLIEGGNIVLQPNAGNVGIGVPNPKQKLDVSGGINARAYYLNGAPLNTQTQSTYYLATPTSKIPLFVYPKDTLTPSQPARVWDASGGWNWEVVNNPLNAQAEPPGDNGYALYRKGDITGDPYFVPNGGISPIYEEVIPLPSYKGAVVGITLKDSNVDDGGWCMAGFKNYFVTMAVAQAFYMDTWWSGAYGFPQPLLTLNADFDGNWGGGSQYSASTLRSDDWIFDRIPSGSYWVSSGCGATAQESCTRAGGYTKAGGLNYVPPGQTLIVRGRVGNNGGGSYIKCKVSVIYAGGSTPTPQQACVGAAGSWLDIGGGTFVCKFTAPSCPSGWSQYQNWSTTSPSTCNGLLCLQSKGGQGTSCTTGSHIFSNSPTETCTYIQDAFAGYGYCANPLTRTCYASISEIGCI